MAFLAIEEELAPLREELWQRDIIYFPVRHHSPACASHLERLIAERRPRAVLVEGPTTFEPLLPTLLDSRTRPPVAFYTTFIDQQRRLGRPKSDGPDFGPARFAAYYPFAEYSPEWVALQAGAAIGAELRFIDLDYASQVVRERRDTAGATARAQTLLHERHLQRSRYLHALAQRSGCRDFDEMWDHLFESRADVATVEEFTTELAAYCWMARRESSVDELAADATLAREQWMATCIRSVLASPSKREGPVLVVTGGFHTVALPRAVAATPGQSGPSTTFRSDEVQHFVIRYSFQQLDALNGYNSGMPSPLYYQKIWEQRREQTGQRWGDAASAILVDIGRQTRRRRLATAVSTADAIAALQQARLLAQLRGHPGPMREDVLDGVRGCFSKGGVGDEGAVVMALARELLAGQAIGEVPPDASVPPIVSDFRETAAELRLASNDGTRRKVALELYRKVRHRRVSRFFHSLEFIGVPFARLLAGPDFVRGTDTGRLIEHWECAWTPRTDSALIDAAVYGATVSEAAVARLREFVAKLSTEGKGRNAAAAVEILIRACRMGLHAHCADLMEVITTALAEDPSFVSVVRACEQFVLLWQAREPLEAHNLSRLPELVRTALMRASSLVPSLATCPAAERAAVLQALLAMRTLLGSVSDLVDAENFWDALVRVRQDPVCEPIVAGAALGLLHGVGKADAATVAREGAGYLGAVGIEWNRRIEFLRGLLSSCREIAWQSTEVLAAVDRLMQAWTEEEFVRALPEMRLAFADLTPRETDKTGAAVAQLHGAPSIGDLFNRDVAHAEFEQHRRLSIAVLEALKADGLRDWAEQEVARE